MAAKVAINGLGRIGRATLKIVVDHPELELVGINDLVPADNLAYLLNFDSVYGRYKHGVKAEAEALVIKDKRYPVTQIKDPEQLPWGKLGVDIVFECTGVFNRGEDLAKHLQAGAKFAILSAPGKSDDTPTVVYSVNKPDAESKVISCASCTTNAITPVVEVMGRRIGIKKATMTTVHAYTSTQAIVDLPNKKFRRGRAGAINMVPTSTGAAKATSKALPQYKGKFDGVAVRVPIPVGSLADLVFVTERATTPEEINDIFREEARSDRYKGVLGISEEPIVSSDIVGDNHATIVDLELTQVVDGDLVKIMTWYDNEWGYASQMVRQALDMVAAKG